MLYGTGSSIRLLILRGAVLARTYGSGKLPMLSRSKTPYFVLREASVGIAIIREVKVGPTSLHASAAETLLNEM